jgi:hypothetical protein
MSGPSPPVLTVIVATYNNRPVLERCLLANGQLFYDRWSSMVVREADRPRRNWLRRADPPKRAWTIQRALWYSLKAATPVPRAASTVQ